MSAVCDELVVFTLDYVEFSSETQQVLAPHQISVFH